MFHLSGNNRRDSHLDEVMEAADREPLALFDHSHIGRFCFSELGDMSPVVGDQVAHWFTDLGTDKDAVVPGWANGKIKTLNRAAGTFTVLYSDGLEADGQELNVKDYGHPQQRASSYFGPATPSACASII